MMVIIFIKTTITYFSLKSKIYQKKVPVMTNRTLKRTSVFVNINPIMTVMLCHLRISDGFRKKTDFVGIGVETEQCMKRLVTFKRCNGD